MWTKRCCLVASTSRALLLLSRLFADMESRSVTGYNVEIIENHKFIYIYRVIH